MTARFADELQFVRNNRTGRVHIRAHVPERGETAIPLSFAEGLAAMFTTKQAMLCPLRLLVGAGPEWQGTWTSGDEFADDELCIACVRALGAEQWRAFHIDNRGSS